MRWALSEQSQPTSAPLRPTGSCRSNLGKRTLMFATFVVMAAIEISLLIDKPNARYFAVTILAVGLILRGLVQERRMKKEAAPALSPRQLGVDVGRPMSKAPAPSGGEAILCAVRSAGRTLDF